MGYLADLFDPHPEAALYSNPKVLGLLVLMGVLIVASFGIGLWRKRQPSALTRKLSRSWANISLWFGIVGIFLVIARTENVLFLSMRFLWVLWLALFVSIVVLQVRIFRSRHYTVLPRRHVDDPLQQYLPKRKRR